MPTPTQKLEQVKSAWRIALGVLGLLGGVAIILVLLGILLQMAFVKPTIAGGLTSEQRYQLLDKSRAQDHRLLSTYGWMDKSKGVVRIPIESAMEKLLQENANP